MTRELLVASWMVVRHSTLLVPVGVALLLVAVTVPVLDDGHAANVLRGAGVLLACAWAVSMDDPCGEVLGAAPYPRWLRSVGRVLAASVVILPAWVLAAATVEVRASGTPVLGFGLHALALATVGVAIGAGARAWRGLLAPSHFVVPAVVLVAVCADGLPRWYAMSPLQTWGPPWEATQIRWAAVLLFGLALALLAWRDPMSRRAA